jgi:hypothetical protein
MRKRCDKIVVGDTIVSWPAVLLGPQQAHFKSSSLLLFEGIECCWDKNWVESPFLILEIHKKRMPWAIEFNETVFKILTNESTTGYILVRDNWKFRVL